MLNWFLKKQMNRANSRSEEPDLRTGEVPQPIDKPTREQRFAALPRCHLKTNSCRYMRKSFDDQRCSMAVFAHTDCPYLGKVEPLTRQVREEVKETERLRVTVVAPPQIEET